MFCVIYFLFHLWQLKRWERKECKPNSLPILHKMQEMRCKSYLDEKGGKVGEITKIFKHDNSVIVKDLNLKTKHVKSREEGEPGQIIKVVFISLASLL